ncbi:MAG: HAMP domain-containing histidine kinase [Clostridiales bacterium]|nr:HAMP domain-containing histidine kinase [Clostridiales bacterium]
MKNKKVSANFAVFIISFLIFTTVLVFALLLVLSYENMYNTQVADTIEKTDLAAKSLASDIRSVVPDNTAFVFTRDNDGSGNLERTLTIEKFVNSPIYSNEHQIMIVDSKGVIYMSNMKFPNDTGLISTVFSTDSKYKISDSEALDMLKDAAKDGTSGISKTESSMILSVCCEKVRDMDFYVVASCAVGTDEILSNYVSLVVEPAIVALIASIVLYVMFMWLSLRPVRNISGVIQKVSEGDYTARVDEAYTNSDNFMNFTVTSEFTEMGNTVNNMIESLQNQEKDREIFISSVAHDIRTPLTSINGFVTAMLDGTIGDNERPKYLEIIKMQVGKIKSLVTSMTEASSLSHVSPEMMEEFNVNEMLIGITDDLESLFDQKNITLVKSLDPGPQIIAYGETMELGRVVSNIVTNAIKFTPVGGKIKISTETDRKERKIWISVDDSGPGIPADKRQRIFESFYKGDPSRKQEGFGLGLYICKQILMGHRQTIVCEESTELGGAKFVFSFPYPPEE